jgi:hypothetical protein
MKNQLRPSFVKRCLRPLRNVYDTLGNITVGLKEFNHEFMVDGPPGENPLLLQQDHYLSANEKAYIILGLLGYKRLSDIRGTQTSAAVGWSPDGNPNDCPPFYPGIENHEIKELLDQQGISFKELAVEVISPSKVTHLTSGKLNVAKMPGLSIFAEKLFLLVKTKKPDIEKYLSKDELFKQFERWVTRESLTWDSIVPLLKRIPSNDGDEIDRENAKDRQNFEVGAFTLIFLMHLVEVFMEAWGCNLTGFLNLMAAKKSNQDHRVCVEIVDFVDSSFLPVSDGYSLIKDHLGGDWQTETHNFKNFPEFFSLTKENQSNYLEHCEPVFENPKQPYAMLAYLLFQMNRVGDKPKEAFENEIFSDDIHTIINEISNLELQPWNCSHDEINTLIQQVLKSQEPDEKYLDPDLANQSSIIGEIDILMVGLVAPCPGERILDPLPMNGNALQRSLAWATWCDRDNQNTGGELDLDEKLLDPSYSIKIHGQKSKEKLFGRELPFIIPREMPPVKPGMIEIFSTNVDDEISKGLTHRHRSFFGSECSSSHLVDIVSMRLILSGLPASCQLVRTPIQEPSPYSINADVAICHPYAYRAFGDELENNFEAENFFTCLTHLNEDCGRMGIVVPNSFLNIDAKTDENIFKNKARLIREGWLEAVVGLPREIYDATEDPAGALLILRHPASKERQAGSQLSGWEKRGKEILFLKFDIEEDIDESRQDISRIISNFINFEPETDKECLVSTQEIEENEFDLSPDSYILNIDRDMNRRLKSGQGVELKSICEVKRGSLTIEGISENQLSGKIPFIKNISQLTGNIKNPYFDPFQEYQDQEFPKTPSRNLVSRKCILVSRLASSGLKPTIFDPERQLPAKALLLSKDFASIEIKDSEKISLEHLFSLLHDNAALMQVKNLYKDNHSHVNIEDLGKIILPIESAPQPTESYLPQSLEKKRSPETELANQKLKLANQKLEKDGEKMSKITAMLNHDAKKDTLTLDSLLEQLHKFFESHNLLNSPLIENPAEGQDQEFAGKQIEYAMKVLNRLKKRHDNLSKVYKTTFESERYENVDMGKLFEEIKSASQHHDGFQIEVKINLQNKKIPIKKETFVDAIRNIITNASEHAFLIPSSKNMVRFVIDEDNKNVRIDCLNNGAPLPKECNEDWFSTFGQRGTNSEGEGCGGCIIENSIVKAHGGTIQFIKKSNWAFHLRLYLPKQANRE